PGLSRPPTCLLPTCLSVGARHTAGHGELLPSFGSIPITGAHAGIPLWAPTPPRHRGADAGRHQPCPRSGRRLCRAEPAGREEERAIARPDADQLLLREFDADAHLL